jgi:hypothetical protein
MGAVPARKVRDRFYRELCEALGRLGLTKGEGHKLERDLGAGMRGVLQVSMKIIGPGLGSYSVQPEAWLHFDKVTELDRRVGRPDATEPLLLVRGLYHDPPWYLDAGEPPEATSAKVREVVEAFTQEVLPLWSDTRVETLVAHLQRDCLPGVELLQQLMAKRALSLLYALLGRRDDLETLLHDPDPRFYKSLPRKLLEMLDASPPT